MPDALIPSERVWITGAGGLIGSWLLRTHVPGKVGRIPVGWLRSSLELTDFTAVAERFAADRPVAILHAAALSKSPACQADPALARRLNVEVTRRLVELADGIPFVFYSTDLVFDGSRGNYLESDAVNPLSVYAETKVEAERIVLRHPRALVLRTSLNYGTSPTGDRAFNEEMAAAWRAGRTLSLFDDEFRCPIPAVETAQATWDLLSAGVTGLLHLAGRERLSRLEIGQRVASRHADLQPRLTSSSLKSYTGAPRSPDTSLDSSRAESLLGRRLPAFSEWIAAER